MDTSKSAGDNADGASGMITSPVRLKEIHLIGDSNGRILYRSTDRIYTDHAFGNLTLPGMPDPEWQWVNFEHRWGCDIFNSCHSSIGWRAFCKDRRDGTKIAWDVVEVAAVNDAAGFDPNTIGNMPFYMHHQKDISDFGVGWAKQGKEHTYVTGAKCWLGTYWWFWSFRSDA